MKYKPGDVLQSTIASTTRYLIVQNDLVNSEYSIVLCAGSVIQSKYNKFQILIIKNTIFDIGDSWIKV